MRFTLHRPAARLCVSFLFHSYISCHPAVLHRGNGAPRRVRGVVADVCSRRRWIIGYRARSLRYFNLSRARTIMHARRIEDTSTTRDTPRTFLSSPLPRQPGSQTLWLSGGVTRVFFTTAGTLMAATVATNGAGRARKLPCRPISPIVRASLRRVGRMGGWVVVRRDRECRRACAEFMQMYAGNILNK